MELDFALSYSDDWFLLPMALDAWSLFEATEVAVTDVFGDVTVAGPPASRWNLFRLHSSGTRFTLSMLALPSPPGNWFPLLPATIGRLALGTLWSARTQRPAGQVLAELRASRSCCISPK